MIKNIKYKINSFFLSQSKRVGLNLPYFLKNGFWVSLRYGILALSGLIISIAFTRFGEKELLGQYQFVLSFISFVSIFSLLGLNVSALKSVIQGQEAGIIRAVRISFFASIIGAIIVIAYGIYRLNDNNLLGSALILSGFSFPFFYAPNTWYTFYEGKSLFREVSLRTILINIAITLGIIPGLFFGLNVLVLIAIYLFINIIFHWAFYFEVLTKIKDKSNNLLDTKYGIYVSLQKFVYGFSNNAPPIAISFLFGFDLLAIYHITYYVIGTISGFLGSLSSIYMPLLFKNIKLDYKRIVLQNIAIGFLFFLGFGIFVKLFFLLLYGEDYMGSVQLAYYLSFILILLPLRIFLINFFTTQKKNFLIICVFAFANLISLGIFYLVKNTGFNASVSIYLYSLQFLIVIPLLVVYFSTASNKIDSMR